MSHFGRTGAVKTKAVINSTGADIGRGLCVTTAERAITLATTGGTPTNVTVDGFTIEDIPDGRTGSIAYKIGEVVELRCGGTVACGDLVMPTTGGEVIKVTDGNGYVARSVNEASISDNGYGLFEIIYGVYDLS